MREKIVEKYLTKKVEESGGMCLKWVSPGTSGVPDRICILPGGEVIFVELKAPGKKTKPRQREVIARIKELGHSVYVLTSIEEVERFFNADF